MPVPVDHEAISAALSHISAANRDIWIRIGMAIKSELGEEGFSLFDNWSHTAENYDSKAVKTSWRSFKQSGKIGIGTLLHEAQNNGFNLKQFSPVQSLTANELAQAKKDKAQCEQEAATKLMQQQEDAAVV